MAVAAGQRAWASETFAENLEKVISIACSPAGQPYLRTLASTIRLAATTSFEAHAEVVKRLPAACPELRQAYARAVVLPRLGPSRGQSSGVSRPPDADDTPDD